MVPVQKTFLLALSVIPAYLFVTRRSTRFGGVVSGLAATLAPFIVSRSQPGGFDTDAILTLLPLCAVTSALECAEADKKRSRLIYGLISIVFLVMIFFTWNRWYVYALLVAGILILALLLDPAIPKWVRAITLAAVILCVICMLPTLEHFASSLNNYINKDSNTGVREWPNPFLVVSELKQLPFHPLVIYGGGLAPLKMRELFDFSGDVRSRVIVVCFTVLLGITVMLGPVRYSYQNVSQAASGRLISEDMSDACIFLRNETPEDSVLVSWWDYGHYYNYAAERKALTAGNNHTGYLDTMIARGLMTPDSEKAREFFCEALGESSTSPRYLIISGDMPGKTEGIKYYADWKTERREDDDHTIEQSLIFRLFSDRTDPQKIFELVYDNDSVTIYRF